MPVSTYGGSVKVIRVDWTSDASGDATENVHVNGQVTRAVTIPGAGGTQPTAAYDVTLVDEDGLDILGGAGEDRSNTDTEQLDLSGVAPLLHYGPLTFTVADAGDSNTGTAKIYLR